MTTSSVLPKTVLLGGDPLANEGTVITAAITPGMAVLAAGASVARAGANALAPSFARENELVGKGINDDYAIGERCLYWTPRKGDRFYAILAASQEIAAGAALQCAANGALAAQTSTNPTVARALEAVTTGGSVGRIKVEIV